MTISATNGVHCQVSSAAIVSMTVLGSESHSAGGRPTLASSQLAIPKLGSRMTIAIMPTTTGRQHERRDHDGAHESAGFLEARKQQAQPGSQNELERQRNDVEKERQAQAVPELLVGEHAAKIAEPDEARVGTELNVAEREPDRVGERKRDHRRRRKASAGAAIQR